MVRCLRVAPIVLLLGAGKAHAASPESVPVAAQPATSKPAAIKEPEAPAAPADSPASHTIDFPEGGARPTPPAPPPGPAVAPPQGETPGEMDKEGNYTVKHGDTLWDLSQQFLNNPWYWPKIWADNPVVENPHWIYPGNRLKIRNNGAGLPGEVGPASENGNAPKSDDTPSSGYDNNPETVADRRELPDFSKGSVLATGAFAQDSDLVSLGGSVPIGFTTLPNVMRVRVTSLVTQRELAEAGYITHSFAQKELLIQYDKVYLKFPNLNEVKVGQIYSVFRTADPVVHPVTKQRFGYQTHIVGTIQITGKTATEAVGEVGPGVEDMSRGDHLALNANLEKSVELAPNEVDLSGYILTTDVDGLTIPSQNHAVFVDKGSKDGVKVGNTFLVIETGDGLQRLQLMGELDKRDKEVQEVVATLVVFNVSDHSSAAMVVKSLRELSLGDRVEMYRPRPSSAGAGGDVR